MVKKILQPSRALPRAGAVILAPAQGLRVLHRSAARTGPGRLPLSGVWQNPACAEVMAMKLIAALLSFSVSLAVSQSTDQAAAAVQTFRPSADTYVDQAYPNRSFGSAKRLRVGAGSRPAKQVYRSLRGRRFGRLGLPGETALLRHERNGERTRRLQDRGMAQEAPHLGTATCRRQRPARQQGLTHAWHMGGMGCDPVGNARRRLQVRPQGRHGGRCGPRVS